MYSVSGNPAGRAISAKPIHSTRGSAIFPLLIISTVISIMMASLIGILYPLMKSQINLAAKTQIFDAIENLRVCAFDTGAWVQTSKANAGVMQCLTSSAGCADQKTGKIQILRANGQPCIDGYNPKASPDAGLTDNAVACTGFDLGTGNDACPYRFEFNWIVSCPAGFNPCTNPAQSVVMELKYAPLKHDKVALNLGDGVYRKKFGGAPTSAITLYTGSRSDALGLYTDSNHSSDQSIALLRSQVTGAGNRNPLVIWEIAPIGIPGGSCDGVKTRNLNFVQNDPALMVTADITKLKGVLPLRAGQYDCTISAPGFGVGLFSVALNQINPAVNLLNGNSSLASTTMNLAQVRSTGIGRFILPKPTTIQLQQFCRESAINPPKDKLLTPDLLQGALGMPVGMDLEIYSVLECSVAELP